LLAEQSFCVQIKASSVREFVYDRRGYEWLRTLSLPLFVASVDVVTQELVLYTSHNLACRIDAEHYDSVVVYLDPPERPTPDERRERYRQKALHQHLGEPILRWTHAECQSTDAKLLLYSVLSSWVAVEQLHCPLRSIKTTQRVSWRTNEPPQAGGIMSMNHPDELRHDVAAAAPYLMKLGSHFMSQDPPSVEAVAFMLLCRWLEAHGEEYMKYPAQILAQRCAALGMTLTLNARLEDELGGSSLAVSEPGSGGGADGDGG
jgi:hypothetical protein